MSTDPNSPARGTSVPNGMKTHCPQGHEYDEQNTIRYAGRRFCRECHRVRTLRWAREARAKRAAEKAARSGGDTPGAEQ